MRAVIARPGGPEVLEMREVPAPAPSRGEVRVRVRATAVNRADVLQRMGLYPAPEGAPRDIPGLELAGEVDELGDDVHELRVGDRVMGLVAGGAYAEHVVAHERALAKIPSAMSFTEAAAIPEAFVTAWDAMVTQAKLEPGEDVLVHAAGSGVGTAAVQIGAALGARVIGTARSTDKLDRAKDLGLRHAIVPSSAGRFAKDVLAATGERGVDVVLDLVGGAYVTEDLACVAPRARVVVVGLVGGPRAEIDLSGLLRQRVTLIGTVLRSRPIEEKIAAGLLLRKLTSLFEAARLRPVVDRVFPLDRAAEAHERLVRNAPFGKLVLET